MVLFCHVNPQDHVIKESCDANWVEALQEKSTPCQVWWPCASR